MESEKVELTPREAYRLKKLLSGSAGSGEGKPSSSDEVAFDAEELALVVKEAVREALDEYAEEQSGSGKGDGNGKVGKSAKQGEGESKKRRVVLL